MSCFNFQPYWQVKKGEGEIHSLLQRRWEKVERSPFSIPRMGTGGERGRKRLFHLYNGGKSPLPYPDNRPVVWAYKKKAYLIALTREKGGKLSILRIMSATDKEVEKRRHPLPARCRHGEGKGKKKGTVYLDLAGGGSNRRKGKGGKRPFFLHQSWQGEKGEKRASYLCSAPRGQKKRWEG